MLSPRNYDERQHSVEIYVIGKIDVVSNYTFSCLNFEWNFWFQWNSKFARHWALQYWVTYKVTKFQTWKNKINNFQTKLELDGHTRYFTPYSIMWNQTFKTLTRKYWILNKAFETIVIYTSHETFRRRVACSMFVIQFPGVLQINSN